MNIATQIKQGDISVFNQVFEQYHEQLYFYIFSKTKSTFYAEEVTQITFIKLWQNRQNLNEGIPIASQIFRIGKTSLIDLLRKTNSSENLLNTLSKSSNATDSNFPFLELEHKELNKKLHSLMNEMPPQRRKVFEMSRIHGFSYKEIAFIQSVSIKTVENHINHALKQVRKVIPYLLLLNLF